MISAGQIVLFAFPQTDQITGKLRPALLLRHLPGPYDDWLICMISSQLRHEMPGIDEVIHDTDSDFAGTGLKETSVIRVTRLAVVAADILPGAIGNLTEQRWRSSAPVSASGFSAAQNRPLRSRAKSQNEKPPPTPEDASIQTIGCLSM
jgi:mRNA interferase MazF